MYELIGAEEPMLDRFGSPGAARETRLFGKKGVRMGVPGLELGTTVDQGSGGNWGTGRVSSINVT